MKITYLYIKLHKLTNLKYFGKTIKNVYTYHGSGKYWNNHLRKHGYDHVITLKIWKFTDIEECKKFAVKFSIDNNIIVSKSWANLVNENGIDGGSGAANPMFGKSHTLESKLSMSKAVTQRQTGTNWYNNGFTSKMCKIHPGAGWTLGRLFCGDKNSFYGLTHSKETRKQISESKKGIPSPKKVRDGYEKYVYTVYWTDGRIDTTTNLSEFSKKYGLKLNLSRFTRPNPPKSKTLLKIERLTK